MPNFALKNLVEACNQRSLALFIGADMPSQISGVPSRADLAQAMAKRYGADERLSLAEVAARVSHSSSRFEFTDFLRTALDTTGKQPQLFHQQVARLVQHYGLTAILTTAYDNLLEMVFLQMGIAINHIVRSSDVPFARPDRPSLIKLYGDVQHPETLIVTDLDHSNLLRDRDKAQVIDEARQVSRRNTILFLGYNLADPDFQFIFGDIAQSNLSRPAYAILPGLPQVDQSMWRDRKVNILDQESLTVLQELSEAVKGGSTQSTISPASQEKIASIKSTGGALPAEFYTQLRKTLLECGPFESNRQLRAVFVHAELSPWQNGLPEADSQGERVDLLISYLTGKRHSNGKPALEIFLNELVERSNPLDACHNRFVQLTEQLKNLS